MPRRPGNFPAQVRRTLANRVGYLCSNPACNAPTTGPHHDTARINCVGVAAHIHAAEDKKARYNPALSLAQIKAIENAVWLCQTCADMIDNDEDSYPVSLLREWKLQAEAKAGNLLGKATAAATDIGTSYQFCEVCRKSVPSSEVQTKTVDVVPIDADKRVTDKFNVCTNCSSSENWQQSERTLQNRMIESYGRPKRHYP